MFTNKGDYTDHVKELRRKGRLATNKVWDLEERTCRDDFNIRRILFRYLVISVMTYGIELWGWGK